VAVKRKNRKELVKQQDGFLTFSQRLLATVVQYKVHVISGLALMLAVVLLVSGIRYMGIRAENQAFALMEKGVSEYEKALESDGAEKAYAQAGETFQQLLEDYGARDGGRLGRIVYAGMAYDAGDFDTAISLYRAALDEADAYPGLKPLILSGLGRAYEAKEAYAQAAESYEMIAKGEDRLMKEEACLRLGFIYDRMGNAEKSAEVFQKFVADYPNSTYIGMVKEKLANG
jgi:tetratricopeptide (TPR) repeat protein